MPQVYNWQLGREMLYPYEPAKPQRQFAAVFNINRCLACQTCTMACKSTWTFGRGQEYMWWNNVESKPYEGYPQFWDVKLVERLGAGRWEVKKAGPDQPYGVYDGETIFEAAAGPDQAALGYLPEDREWSAPNIYEDTPTKLVPEAIRLPAHQTWFFYLQRICNHCSYPACLAACPRLGRALHRPL